MSKIEINDLILLQKGEVSNKRKLEIENELLTNKKLKKEYEFSTYVDAINFVNSVAKLAEDEQHHPYIHINFKKILVIMFTHKIDGLHENDFIMASKCDNIKK